MTIEQIVFNINLLAWITLGIYCAPAMLRLFRGRNVTALDPLKTAICLMSVAQLHIVVVRNFARVALSQFTGVPVWTAAVVLLTLAIVLVIVVLRKTDKALSPHLRLEE
jgi:hypothetical protein